MKHLLNLGELIKIIMKGKILQVLFLDILYFYLQTNDLYIF